MLPTQLHTYMHILTYIYIRFVYVICMLTIRCLPMQIQMYICTQLSLYTQGKLVRKVRFVIYVHLGFKYTYLLLYLQFFFVPGTLFIFIFIFMFFFLFFWALIYVSGSFSRMQHQFRRSANLSIKRLNAISLVCLFSKQF